MDEYNSVCAVYNNLCANRSDPSFWAENILEGTQGITNKLVWQNFYAFLCNENHKFTDQWQPSLGELVDTGFVLEDGNVTFKEHKVQNGNITHIQLTPTNNLSCTSKSNKENEQQMAGLLKTVSKEAPGHESQNCDEKCEQ